MSVAKTWLFARSIGSLFSASASALSFRESLCKCGHIQPSVRHNSNRSSIAKIGRTTYTRMYPTMLVQPDGSTINIRYKEPRRIITLPFDITMLSEEKQKLRLAKRRPKTKIKIEEDIDVTFDASKYLKTIRKKK